MDGVILASKVSSEKKEEFAEESPWKTQKDAN